MRAPSAGDRALALAVALLCLATLAWLQSGFPFLWDGDSYFHVRAAQQLGEHGVQKRFPQTVYSTWSERYSDKDFLFHVALIPFVGSGDPMGRGK